MTRVLVVDDSPRLRSVIGNVLATSGYDVVTADLDDEPRDALEGSDPDVVTIAVGSRTEHGLETAERLLAASPTPTLVVGCDSAGALDRATDISNHGAVELLQTPAGTDPNATAFLDELVDIVDELAAMDVATLAAAYTAASARSIRSTRKRQPAAVDGGAGTALETDVDPEPTTEPASTETRSKTPTTETTPAHSTTHRSNANDRASPTSDRGTPPVDSPTIVVGASTGGPSLIERLFATLPAALEATVLVVQHMPADFTPRFAARLDAVSEYSVREPRDGERLQPETAFVAPGDSHLGVTTDADGHRRVQLVDDIDRRPRPSIDVTMTQAADHTDGPLCGVVLSGMGRDGVAGIEAITAAGGRTIAQDEATSSVFGIPAKAIETGCIDSVVPSDNLVETIIDAITGETDE